jgi:hypothetical protein
MCLANAKPDSVISSFLKIPFAVHHVRRSPSTNGALRFDDGRKRQGRPSLSRRSVNASEGGND